MEYYLVIAVIGIGFIAGFINTVAGSGSLLTLPLLMFLGLPANVANGTNRIAILLQNVVGITSFRQQKVLSFRDGLRAGIPAAAGSFAGASIAVRIDDEVMGKVIGFLLILMFLLIIFRPARWTGEEKAKAIPFWLQAVIFFLIGIYGGFIQAGVGFFLLAGLVLGAGMDLVRANAVKVFVVFLYTPLALVVFMVHHQVDYRLGLLLAAGNMAGAFAGSRMAVKWGARVVRYFLLFALALAGLKLLGIFDFIPVE